MSVVFAATLKKIQSSAQEPNTWNITLSTQEMDGDQVARIAGFSKKYVKVYFTDQNILQAEIKKEIDELDLSDTNKPKTRSQRLRQQLWRCWKAGPQDTSFDQYYNDMMDKLIDHYKVKADEQV